MRIKISEDSFKKILTTMEKFLTQSLSKEDRVKMILDKFNYNELSYWQRKSLLNEIKAINKLKENFNNTILDDVIESIGKIFRIPIREVTLTTPIKKNPSIILLQNIYGNNSAEKPNN